MIKKLLWSTFLVLMGCFIYVSEGAAESFDKEMSVRNPEFHILTGTSDPEFSFWLPKRAGNLKFGVIVKDTSVWFSDMKDISFRKDKETYTWTIKNKILGQGKITLTALSLKGADGVIIKADCAGTPQGTALLWMYGGAADTPFDINDAALKPAQCFENKNNTEPFEFTLYYGQSMALRVLIGIYPRQSQVRDVNPHIMTSPLALYQSGYHSTDQAVAGKIPNASTQPWYFTISGQNIPYYDTDLPKLFQEEASK